MLHYTPTQINQIKRKKVPRISVLFALQGIVIVTQ